MGLPEDFDDRQTQIDSEAEAYHPYEYQTENNDSWAGALPVKQYVVLTGDSNSMAMLTKCEQRIVRSELGERCLWCRLRLVRIKPHQ